MGIPLPSMRKWDACTPLLQYHSLLSVNYAITVTRLLYSCSYQTFDKDITSVTQPHTPWTQRTICVCEPIRFERPSCSERTQTRTFQCPHLYAPVCFSSNNFIDPSACVLNYYAVDDACSIVNKLGTLIITNNH